MWYKSWKNGRGPKLDFPQSAYLRAVTVPHALFSSETNKYINDQLCGSRELRTMIYQRANIDVVSSGKCE